MTRRQYFRDSIMALLQAAGMNAVATFVEGVHYPSATVHVSLQPDIYDDQRIYEDGALYGIRRGTCEAVLRFWLQCEQDATGAGLLFNEFDRVVDTIEQTLDGVEIEPVQIGSFWIENIRAYVTLALPEFDDAATHGQGIVAVSVRYTQRRP